MGCGSSPKLLNTRQSGWLMGCAIADCQVTDFSPGRVTKGPTPLLANGCSVAHTAGGKGGFSCSDLPLSSSAECEPSGVALPCSLGVEEACRRRGDGSALSFKGVQQPPG